MNDQEEEINARDVGAEEFEKWYLQKGILYDEVERNVVINALDLKDDDIVLDAGCGVGRLTIEVAKQCKKAYGLDFSPKSIEVLRDKLKERDITNVETFVCSITEPLPVREKVDKILSIPVIQHIPSDEGRLTALVNLYNQLEGGGVCLISVYNYNILYKYRGFLKEGKFAGGIHYRMFTPTEMQYMFEKCGFKDVSVRGYVNFKGYHLVDKYAYYKLFYPIEKLDLFLSKFKFSCSLGNYLICRGIK